MVFQKEAGLPLQNLPNTRDLGALMTVDGSHILPRKLLRSGEIYHASAADNRILSEEYNVKTVIDFRSAAEVKKNRMISWQEWSIITLQSGMRTAVETAF